MRRRRDGGEYGVYADDILVAMTGQPQKVCYRAMERADRRGLVDYGMWLRGGWLTEKGEQTLNGLIAGDRMV